MTLPVTALSIRGLAKRFGSKIAVDGISLEVPAEKEVRVWDSTSDVRYFVLPERPAGTEGMAEEELAKLVTVDSLIGAGYALTEPWEDVHWLADKAAAGVRTHYLKLRLECLHEMPLITLDELAKPPFRRVRWAVRQSGTRMPSTIADALEPWWEERAKTNSGGEPLAPALSPRAGRGSRAQRGG